MNKYPLLFLFLCVCFSSVFAQETRYFTQSIYFESNVHILDDEAKSTLDALVLNLQESPDFDLKIEAFTDEQGSIAYNNALAERRAASAASFLLSKNIQPRSTELKGFGESQQRMISGDLEERRRINRRVDILVTAYYFNDLSSLLSRLDAQKKDEVFRFKASSDEQRFTSARGTQVIIPGNAFVFEDGTSPTGTIEFKLREAYDPSAWFLNKLSTETADGALLQTAGMVYSEASSEGKPLSVQSDKKLTISVPLQSARDDDMELFYGDTHAEKSGTAQSVVWQAVPTNQLRNSLKPRKKRPKYALEQDVIDVLKTIEIESPLALEEPKFLGDLHYPVAPLLPTEPRFGFLKPEREDVKFKPYDFRERFYSKKKRTRIEDQRFAKKLKRYEKSKARYDRKKAEYDAKMAVKADVIEAYEKERTAWGEEVTRRLTMRYAYEKNNYLQRAVPIANTVLENADKLRMSCAGSSKQLLQRINYIADAKAKTSGKKAPSRTYSTRHYNIPLSRIGLSETNNPRAKNAFRKDMIAAHLAARKAISYEFYPLFPLLEDNETLVEMSKSTKDKAVISCVASGDEVSLRAYVFDITQMGWCNIDRLMKLNPKQIMAIKVHESEEAMLTVLVPKINASVNMLAMKDNTYQSRLKLPKGETAIIIGMKVKDGIAQLAVHEFTVGEDETPILEYRSLPMHELRKELELLNS